MEPQLLLPVLQSALLILAVTSKVTCQVSCVGSMIKPLKSLAKNCCVSTVPKVAVAGVRGLRSPQSKPMLNFSVFFLSAVGASVMVLTTFVNLFCSRETQGWVKVEG